MNEIQENNVIDNKKVILKNELLKILPKTENANIAVGYFFVSGLAAIITPLKNVNKICLLISNTTDKTTAEAIIEGFHNIREAHNEIDKINFLNDKRKNKIIFDSKNNIIESLEYMNQTADDKKVVKLLIEMMKSKQLEIRIYPKEKLHAKVYIFQPKDDSFAQGLGIVGSSNLSLAGISHNSELNLKTYNPPDINQLLSWFHELWEDGLEFTDDFNLILGKSWAGKLYSPYELFLKASYLEYENKLEEQHKIDPIWGTTFPKLFPFQKIAVDQVLTMLDLYGGAIIGDVVGLGKTYIGTALLKYLQLQDYRPLIICPPPLISMWKKFCADYEIDAKVLSRGMLSQQNFELSQNYLYRDRDLVLLDESHHFSNNSSRQYENLHQFMQARDAKAILLTATPFSNNASDIKNQIMLFHQSEKTYIPPANHTDLNTYFKHVKEGNANLIDLLKNIMIRRTRRFVLNQWGKTDENGRKYLQVGTENKYFPQRKMQTERYDINKVYHNKYKEIVSYLDKNKLTFARYSIGLYVKKDYESVELYKNLGNAGIKLVGLIRTLLLKRMESSLEAFKQSITHYINTHNIFLKLLHEKFIPIGDISYKTIYDMAQSDPDSINDPETIDEFKTKIKNAGDMKYKFEAFDISRLISDIKNDINIFETIRDLIDPITWETDDKLLRIQKLLNNKSGKKILIFTEFTATAKYLHNHLKWNGIKEQIDSSDGNSIKYARKFDPDNNPSNEPKLKKSEEITLLISTDVLSEGVNLQAGEIIINYDFHWNPTRLIQRAGRVDRIGSKNDFIMIHNFLLDLEIEKDLKLEHSVDNKINNIQKIIGEDYEILKKNERINTNDIYAIYGENNVILDNDNNFLEPSEYEKKLRNIQINKPEFWKEIKNMPNGIRSSINIKSNGRLLLVCENGTMKSGKIRKYYIISSKSKIDEVSSQNALKILESNDEQVYDNPNNYDELVAIGWGKFIEDIEQINAKVSTMRLSMAQKWVIMKLMKIDFDKMSYEQKNKIDQLRKAYSIPIIKGKLNRELLKIKKSDVDDSELIENLSQLYLHYDLHNNIKKNAEENNNPKILYSEYVGN